MRANRSPESSSSSKASVPAAILLRTICFMVCCPTLTQARENVRSSISAPGRSRRNNNNETNNNKENDVLSRPAVRLGKKDEPAPPPTPPPIQEIEFITGAPTKAPTQFPTPAPTPAPTPSPSASPSSQPTQAPSSKPTPTPKTFESTMDLYVAVDEYVAATLAGKDERATDAVRDYGYPMNDWKVGDLTNFSRVFDGSRNADMKKFNENIADWDVGSAIYMDGMFKQAETFNRDLPWNTGSVVSMNQMFYDAFMFNGTISGWDVRNVENMIQMFIRTKFFNGDITGWNVMSLVYAEQMFAYSIRFNRDISPWNLVSIRRLNQMFLEAESFNQNLCPWGPRLLSSKQTNGGVQTKNMFVASGCTFKDNPTGSVNFQAPWCAVDTCP